MEQINTIVKPAVQPMTDATTQRTKETDVEGTVHTCLVENSPIMKGVDPVHALERGVTDKRAAALEWAWKMRKNTLNLDTRRNTFYVGATVRALYEQKRWALIPEESTVDKYFDETCKDVLPRGQFPDLDDESSYQYKILPIQRMEFVCLQHVTGLPEGGHNVKAHFYPYNEFPIITASVDPKYVIARLGFILTSLVVYDQRDELRKGYPILDKIIALYNAWTKNVPEDAEKDESYVDPLEALARAELEAATVAANPAAPDATEESSQAPAKAIRGAKNSKKKTATSTKAKPASGKGKTSTAQPTAPKVTEESSRPPANAVRVTRSSTKRAVEENPAPPAESTAKDKPVANKRRKVNPVEVADPTTGDAIEKRVLRPRNVMTEAKAPAPAPAKDTRAVAPKKATVAKKATRPRTRK